MKERRFYLFALLLVLSCTAGPEKKALDTVQVSINVYGAQNIQVYLVRIPIHNEKRQLVDSAIIRSVKDSVIFYVPRDEERLYQIVVKNTNKTFPFIADGPFIHIKASNVTGAYTITGSAASSSLKTFDSAQLQLSLHAKKIYDHLDSLRLVKVTGRKITELQQELRDSLALLNQRNIGYADTVGNPVAFLSTYDKIDFGKDYTKWKDFVLRAARRFEKSKHVQNLKQEALAIIDIYENEFEIGEHLPAIALPNLEGDTFNTASLRGRYYLIDFWATWCPRCMDYNKYKKEAAAMFPSTKFSLVSVALDDNISDWKNFVLQENLNWIQLIDKNMWIGTAAKTLKFDSIPFNFLVSPNGMIVAKAIKPDSLLYVLRASVK